MHAKRILYAENFEEMTEEIDLEEERRFRLIDYNNLGFITWNAFIEFEAANLISKRNKVKQKWRFSINIFFGISNIIATNFLD
jgi:hypothetical protein